MAATQLSVDGLNSADPHILGVDTLRVCCSGFFRSPIMGKCTSTTYIQQSPTSASWPMRYTSMQRPVPPAQYSIICTFDDSDGESCDPTRNEVKRPGYHPFASSGQLALTGKRPRRLVLSHAPIARRLWGGVFVVDPAARAAIHQRRARDARDTCSRENVTYARANTVNLVRPHTRWLLSCSGMAASH
jgi:hypothetical protein